MSDDIRAMFEAKAMPAPGRGSRDAISLFKGSVRTQITRAEDAKAGKAAKTTALNWFKPYDGGYSVQLGKKPITFGANTHWRADDLDEVIRLLEGALALADSDKEFQSNIRTAAKENKPTTAAANVDAPPVAKTRKPRKTK